MKGFKKERIGEGVMGKRKGWKNKIKWKGKGEKWENRKEEKNGRME